MLAVTGGLWSVIEQVNGYFKWRKSGPDQPYNGKTQFALSVRLALLLCLVSNGRTNWMYRTGAWWRILTIHRSRIVSLYIPRGDNGRLNAGEHVSKYDIWGQFRGHIEGDKCMGHNSFRVEGTRWTSARGEDED